MPISNAHANATLDGDTAGGLYLALHTSSPGPEANTSTELVGLGYARKLISSWTAAASRSVLNNEGINFTSLPAATVTHVSVWDSVSGGTMLYFGTLNTAQVVESNGGLDFALQDISITLT